jgi:tetratricopeptide (TPR) repeat protein
LRAETIFTPIGQASRRIGYTVVRRLPLLALVVFAVTAAALLYQGGGKMLWVLWTHRLPHPIPYPLPFKAYTDEVWALVKSARAASRAGDHKRAAALYTQALAIEPGPNSASVDLKAARGSEYNYLGMDKEAFADYDAAITVGHYFTGTDGGIRAFMGRGYAAMNLGKYGAAKADFDAVLKALPKDVPRSSSVLAWRGAAWQGLGNREQAIADYKAALALDPKNGYALAALKKLAAQ